MHGLGLKYLDRLRFEERPWGDVKKAYTHFQNGDVLVAKVTPCFENGKAGIATDLPNGIGAGSSEFCVFRPAAGADKRYLLAWFSTEDFRRRATVAMTGSVGLKRVPKEVFLSEQVPLAPEREQQRIADKLDTVLARVDAVNDRLARVAPLLKRFRQAVLAAATSGRLSTISREGTKQPVTSVPSSWPLVSLSSMSDVIDPNPKHRNPSYQSDGELFLSTTNFAEGGGWDLRGAKHVSMDTVLEQQARCHFTRQSIVFSRKGTIGKVRMVPPIESFALLDSLVVINAKEGLSASYLLIALQSPIVQEQVVRLTRGVALKQVSVGVVRSLEIPLPSTFEQSEIVRCVNILFAFADRLEARLQAAQTAASRLTPALLAKAFRGELVPQDPADEPAAELLKRLAATQPQPANKRGRARASAAP